MAAVRLNVRFPLPAHPGFEGVIRPSGVTGHRDPVWLEVYRPHDPDPVALAQCRRKEVLETASRAAERFLALTFLGTAGDFRWAVRERADVDRFEVIYINRYGVWSHWTWADNCVDAARSVRETIGPLF